MDMAAGIGGRGDLLPVCDEGFSSGLCLWYVYTYSRIYNFAAFLIHR